jgi:hypothetical protein
MRVSFLCGVLNFCIQHHAQCYLLYRAVDTGYVILRVIECQCMFQESVFMCTDAIRIQ